MEVNLQAARAEPRHPASALRLLRRHQACHINCLQVLGLTNFSHWPRDEAAPLRACLRSNAVAREMLLKLATKRLRAMAHVGLTERLEESVVSMAADLGAPLRVGLLVPLQRDDPRAAPLSKQGMLYSVSCTWIAAHHASSSPLPMLGMQASTWMGRHTATPQPTLSATILGRKTMRVRHRRAVASAL